MMQTRNADDLIKRVKAYYKDAELPEGPFDYPPGKILNARKYVEASIEALTHTRPFTIGFNAAYNRLSKFKTYLEQWKNLKK